MADLLKSTAIFTPKSITELASAIAKNPGSKLFAGGTYLMTNPGFYPNTSGYDLISLSDISELSRVVHNEQFIEVGAMVTLQQLLVFGKTVLGQELYNAIESIGSFSIRSRITIGGSLVAESFMRCILSAINATAELKTVVRIGKRKKRYKVITKWIPVSKLYNQDGSIIFDSDSFITRVRIPVTDNTSFYRFKCLGSPLKEPESCVMLAFKYTMSQRNIQNANLCLMFPTGCFVISPDFNNRLSGISFPVTGEQIHSIASLVENEARLNSSNANDLQFESSRRLFEEILFRINTDYLTE